MSSAASLYFSVIEDVVTNVKDSFLDEAVDENVLQELKSLWESKLEASKTINQPARAAPNPPAPVHRVPMAQNGYRQLAGPQGMRPPIAGPYRPPMPHHPQGAAGNSMPPSQQQPFNMMPDPHRLMPVQITIPPQPGNPNSAPRALTVHVPAISLTAGTPANGLLQQVLTQAITQALDLPDSKHATLFLQTQINYAFKIDGRQR